VSRAPERPWRGFSLPLIGLYGYTYPHLSPGQDAYATLCHLGTREGSPSNEGQGRREAPRRKGSVAVSGSEPFRGLPEGRDEQAAVSQNSRRAPALKAWNIGAGDLPRLRAAYS
jgi:hypothetical protein